ncbi:PEP-CTERM sorting domain-containing protein [Nitrosomonas mobilis]|uniref:Ice-binding protein C-terminal domain-containing protein n=1 Tax=Nitrosomonas mobilis TaxID=51642 RepID=A0A1G5SHT1_9PROT|nr:PEP-CTERM sorting domain-containing protein [Nitrosomonas mobilis]SCZ86766.1 exported hypothetical protein [Nitrosomonas mobilis]
MNNIIFKSIFSAAFSLFIVSIAFAGTVTLTINPSQGAGVNVTGSLTRGNTAVSDPVSAVTGANGTAEITFGPTVSIEGAMGTIFNVESFTDFEAHVIRKSGDSFRLDSNQIKEVSNEVTSSTELAFGGTSPPFGFSALTASLASQIGLGKAFTFPSFLSDIDNDGFIEDGIDTLFVAINASLFLSTASEFTIGETFLIENGISDLLPGFYFSTTTIDLDDNLGYTGTPIPDGSIVFVSEFISVSTIPEPNTLLLLFISMIAYFGCRRRR